MTLYTKPSAKNVRVPILENKSILIVEIECVDLVQIRFRKNNLMRLNCRLIFFR